MPLQSMPRQQTPSPWVASPGIAKVAAPRVAGIPSAVLGTGLPGIRGRDALDT